MSDQGPDIARAAQALAKMAEESSADIVRVSFGDKGERHGSLFVYIRNSPSTVEEVKKLLDRLDSLEEPGGEG